MRTQITKFLILKETAIATALTIAIVFVISLLPFKPEFLNPVKQEFEDFDIYDLYYSGSQDTALPSDSNIIIIQVADSRSEIIDQLSKIKVLKPKVIGVDVLFGGPNHDDAQSDDRLKNILMEQPLVPAFKYSGESPSKALANPSLIPESALLKNGGYVNFLGDANTSVVRAFEPYVNFAKDSLTSFALKIAEQYNPKKGLEFRDRNKRVEEIRYSGNQHKFNVFSKDEFEDYFKTDYLINHYNIFKDKVVLLGYLTKGTPVLDDFKFTPLNTSTAKRSYPDMYGVIIQANIIGMILDHRYVSTQSLWISYIVAYASTFTFIYFIIWFHTKRRNPLSLIITAVQIIAIIILLFIFLKLFEWWMIKFNLTPILASMALSAETFRLYQSIANWLYRKLNYHTIFRNL